MRILSHLLNIALFCGIFFIGKLMIARNHQWADALVHTPKKAHEVSKFFLYSGRIFEVMGVIVGGLDGVAVVLLVSRWLNELAIGM